MTLVLALALGACEGPTDAAAPLLDDPGALTNESPVTLTGMAEASARIQVRGGADPVAEAIAEADGRFSVRVNLREDSDNTLLVSQVVAGAESAATQVVITHDGTPPSAPTIEAPASPTRLTSQTIRGTTEPNATILVTGGLADASDTADPTGAFAIEVMLDSSASAAVDNSLSVTATDAAGNTSAAAELTITFDPNIAVEAPVVDALPRATNDATLTLSGTAEPGVGITAVGGATEASTTVESDGSWMLDVGLRPNRENAILVFAVSGTDTSAAARVSVTHDDIAPAAPLLDAQASPTGATLVQLGGLAEGAAMLDVSGGAAVASGTANEVGAFTIEVSLTADATNELSVTATDAAGNTSDAAVLSIVQDSTLEAPIVVAPVSSPTSAPTVTLTGTASPSIEVEISGGASVVTAMSDASGAWSAGVTLNANAINELRLTRTGSGVDTLVTIEHDDTPPSAPRLNAMPSPTGDTMLVVSGSSEARARVSVSGATTAAAATAASDGRFSVTVVIAEETESTLSVIATDRAGNSSSPTTASVAHSASVPAAPSLDETNPPPTSTPSWTVSGTVAAPGTGVRVRITGGAASVEGMTDPATGVFSESVMLSENTDNELTVVSLTGAIESSAALVNVAHDDVAPAAPDSASLSGRSATCLGGVTTGGNAAGSGGAVEAGASVLVENVTRARDATTTATDGGSFTVSIGVCAGDVLRVTATDAAGNASMPTEITAS